MTKLSLLIAILLSGMLCLTGCGDGDSDDSSAAAAAPSGSGSAPADAPAADPGAVAGDPPADAEAAADKPLSESTPTGLRLKDKFVIAGRGVTYNVECDALPGAVRYTFDTSFWGVRESASPSASFEKSGADEPFELCVVADDRQGESSKPSCVNVNQ